MGRLSTRTILINAMHQPDPCPQPPARPLGTTNTQFLHNLACNFPTTHSNLETKTLVFRRFQGAPRDSLRGIARDMRGGTSAVSAGSTGGRQRGRGRSSTAACAQIADHLDENRRKTAIVAEVVCTLGRLSTRTILTNAMHQPDPCPQPPARPLDPLGTANTQLLHNLACNSPTTHSNLETRTLIFCRFQGAPRDSLRGITCEICGGSSAGYTGSAGSMGGRQRSS